MDNSSQYDSNSDTHILLDQLENALCRTEDKIQSIAHIRQLLMATNSIELFKMNQNMLIQNLFDTEDNLRESCTIIKKSLIHQKNLYDLVDFKENKIRHLENRLASLENAFYETQETISNFQTKERSNLEYIKDLEDKLQHTEEEIKITKARTIQTTDAEQNYNTGNNPTWMGEYKDFPYGKYQEKPIIKSIEKETNQSVSNDSKTEKLNTNRLKGIPEDKMLQSANNDLPSNSSKLKATRVADLVMKLTSHPDLLEMVSQLFGQDTIDSLMSCKVDEQLIDNVEKTVAEIARLKAKDSTSKIQEDKNTTSKHCNSPTWGNDANKIEQLSEPNHSYTYDRIASNGLLQKYPKTSMGILQESEKYRGSEYNFESSLRAYSNNFQKKVFNNFTNPHGHYFDAPLQRGGNSKLPLEQSKQSRSKSKGKKNCIRPMPSYMEALLNIHQSPRSSDIQQNEKQSKMSNRTYNFSD